MRAARAAYCNYPFEVCTAYPWPKASPSAHAPGLDCSCSYGTVRHVYEIKRTTLLAENAPVPSRSLLSPLLLGPPPADVSNALNFSKIIAASSLLNRRDNRCVAPTPHRDWWLRSRGRAKRKTKLHSFESPVSSLAITQSGNLPLLSLLPQSSQSRYSIRNLLLI